MKKLVAMVSLYDGGEFIANRLDNLVNSTMADDTEIWVVNANSPDPRDDLIPQKFPINYIKLPIRIGVYAAWNYIIKNSKSKYITNANADDLIDPNGYKKLTRLLDTMPDIGFVYPSWYTVDTPNLSWKEAKQQGSQDGKPGNYRGSLDDSGVGHFPVWRRSLHDEHGHFDESFKALGDADWWARCYYLSGAGFHWCRDFLACYLFRHGQNLWAKEVNESEWNLYHAKVADYKSQKSKVG